jgi:hypothetical protein
VVDYRKFLSSEGDKFLENSALSESALGELNIIWDK